MLIISIVPASKLQGSVRNAPLQREGYADTNDTHILKSPEIFIFMETPPKYANRTYLRICLWFT